ncbi:hypothetical protein ACFLXI_04785 [Chloroflexota bacterium]
MFQSFFGEKTLFRYKANNHWKINDWVLGCSLIFLVIRYVINTFSGWYNFPVPTPFYHLNVAETLQEHTGFLSGISDLIKSRHSSFLLGHVAPDVQVISGQTRESTHFFNLPSRANDLPPWERMLSSYSSLTFGEDCDPDKAVFVAGYLCHLQADWYWVQQIFEPHFGPDSQWKTYRERLYLHNVLRSYLDYQVIETLKPETSYGLTQANPKAWLPFIEIDHLEDWQDFIAKQLKPGVPIQTVEVFASRQGMSPDKYYRLLNAGDELQHQIFDYLPHKLLRTYWCGLLKENVKMLNDFLAKVGGESYANT